MDDGTEEGAWLTVFTGWTDLPGSIEAAEASGEAAEAQKLAEASQEQGGEDG